MENNNDNKLNDFMDSLDNTNINITEETQIISNDDRMKCIFLCIFSIIVHSFGMVFGLFQFSFFNLKEFAASFAILGGYLFGHIASWVILILAKKRNPQSKFAKILKILYIVDIATIIIFGIFMAIMFYIVYNHLI